MGIVWVACLAARAAGVLMVTITSTYSAVRIAREKDQKEVQRKEAVKARQSAEQDRFHGGASAVTASIAPSGWAKPRKPLRVSRITRLNSP